MKHLDWLGLQVTAPLYGIGGAVTSVCFDASGCVQAYVRPPADEKEQKLKEGVWLDVKNIQPVLKDGAPVRLAPAPVFGEPGEEPGASPKGAPGAAR